MDEVMVEIHFSAATIEEARRSARLLLEERLVACAQIIPWVESLYLWNGAIEGGQESKLLLKTRRSLFEKVMKVLKENSRYEIPEITLHPILDANPSYLEWLLKATEASDEKPLKESPLGSSTGI